MARRDPRRLSRRQFALLGTQVAGAVVTVLLGIPIVGFILSPIFRREQAVWREVGDIADVPDRQPTKFEVAFPLGEWTNANVNLAVYVVKINADYRIFSNVCRSEEHTSELQSQSNLVCRLLLEKKQTET